MNCAQRFHTRAGGKRTNLRAWRNRSAQDARPRRLRARPARVFSCRLPPPAIFRPSERVPQPGDRGPFRFRFSRGGYSSLPGQPGRRQLSGRPIVKAVVRLLADRDQIPLGPLQLRIILDRVDMVHRRCLDAPAVPHRLTAQAFVPAKDARPKRQPSLALVIHRQKERRRDPERIATHLPAGYHLGCITKAPNDPTIMVKSFGAGTSTLALALARIHVYDCRFPAMLAVKREVDQPGCRQHSLLRWPAAQWADQFIIR